MAEGDPVNLVCGHQNNIHDHDHIWTNCKWERPSDGFSCKFTQIKNAASDQFEIYEDCPSNMTERMTFFRSTRKTILDGNPFCGIKVLGATLDNTGSWYCSIEYTDWIDYGFSNEWCTAKASTWLEVLI